MTVLYKRRYFIPEDGDNEHQPNVFLAPKPRQPGTPPTLGQVKQSFPLPGRYHFRFKTTLGDKVNGLAVWMDCTDDRQPVYVWKNQAIIAKVTRVGVEEDDEDDDDDEDFKRPTSSQQSHVPTQQNHHQTPSQQHQQKPNPSQNPSVTASHSFDLFDAPASNTTETIHRQSSGISNASSAGTGNLLDDHHTVPTDSGSHHNHNLLDMSFSGGATPGQSATPASSHHNDFLGLTSPPVSGNYNSYGGMPQQQQQQQNFQPQQQQQQGNRTFDSFGANSGGPFGGLGTPWK